MSSLRGNYDLVARPPGVPYNRRMSLNGDETTLDMATDYSGASGPVRFYMRPPTNENIILLSLTLIVTDKGTPVLDGWGSIAAPLPIGIRFFLEDAGGIVYSNNYLRSNRDLIRGAENYEVLTFGTIRVIRYRRNYFPFGGTLELRGNQPDDKFGVELHDNFSTLDEMSGSVDATSFLAQV